MTEEAYMTNSRGFKVPLSQVPESEQLKDNLVTQALSDVLELSRHVEAFKKRIFSDVQDLNGILAEKYHTEIGGTKGNISLTSFDGKSKVDVCIDDDITFGPEINHAKALITKCIEEELDGASDFIRNLVRDAFEVNSQGQYNKNRIFTLRKYRTSQSSDDWQNAMQALDDAVIHSESKTYMRFYQRNEYGKWEQIPLSSKKL